MLSTTIDRLQRAQSVVMVNVQGVKVGQIESIRDSLFKDGLQLQVAKNSLLKRALTEVGTEVPAELLDQPVGLVYAYDDAVAAAKSTVPFTKDIEALEVLGGLMDKTYLTRAEVHALSKLPSRDQLLGQLVGTLAAPLSGMVNVLQGNIRGLVTVLGQVRDAKS